MKCLKQSINLKRRYSRISKSSNNRNQVYGKQLHKPIPLKQEQQRHQPKGKGYWAKSLEYPNVVAVWVPKSTATTKK